MRAEANYIFFQFRHKEISRQDHLVSEVSVLANIPPRLPSKGVLEGSIWLAADCASHYTTMPTTKVLEGSKMGDTWLQH